MQAGVANPSTPDFTELNSLIQICTVFRRLFIMYGLLSVLMLFLGISLSASKSNNSYYSNTLLSLYIVQAISYIVQSFVIYPLGQWINILHFSKTQIVASLLINISSMVLIIVRTSIDLSYCTKSRSTEVSNDDDDYEYGGGESRNTRIAWIVISFMLIMLFNGITLKFLYIFYTKLEHFQEVSRSHPALSMERPTMAEAYVSNAPQGQTLEGKIISVAEPHQSGIVMSPMAVPINNTATISNVTAHNV